MIKNERDHSDVLSAFYKTKALQIRAVRDEEARFTARYKVFLKMGWLLFLQLDLLILRCNKKSKQAEDRFCY